MIRDAPSWFALIPRMGARILLPRSMRPGSRDRSEQAEPQGAGPGPGHRGAAAVQFALSLARAGFMVRSTFRLRAAGWRAVGEEGEVGVGWRFRRYFR